MKKTEVVGEVTHTEPYGPFYLIWVKLKTKGKPLVVLNFDTRHFNNMYEQEGGVIEGRKVKVIGDLGNQTIEFLD